MPDGPGLYRVRRQRGEQDLVYIGQTGCSLRGRLGQLNEAYRSEMPFSDPHTAAPALWALRHYDQCDFEVSVAEVHGTTPHRMGIEALAVTLYRARFGRSPLANFGGMPEGYRKSTGNNARLVAAGRRARGGPDLSAPVRPLSVPVNGDLTTAPESGEWVNWPWSRWIPAPKISLETPGRGLYRLRRPGASELLYVGQGEIKPRVSAHLAKAAGDGRQAQHFAGETQVSWVSLPGLATTNLLEHENDLIAAHVLTCGRPPSAQFLGHSNRLASQSPHKEFPCSCGDGPPVKHGSGPTRKLLSPRTPHSPTWPLSWQ